MAEAHGLKLLLADVDGTLVTKEKVLTDRTRRAVLALKHHGIKFAVTSGRPPRGMHMLVDPLEIDTPIAGFNGGMFANPDFTVIEDHTLEPDLARAALEVLRANKVDVWVYNGDEWYITDPRAPHVEREQHTVQFPPTVTDDLNALLDNAVKIVGVSDDHELMSRIDEEMKKAIGGKATAALSQPYYLDVTHRLANKGTVVAFLSQRFGIDPSAIATIGDMPNDETMFEASGFSIAMGNASDEVKAKANATTDSYDNEGFAKAVETHLLKT